MDISQGLDFLLSHFVCGFPRTISTFSTKNKQVEVSSKEEALKFFEKSDLRDCRINAFGRNEIDNEIPNIIFVDLDRKEHLDEVKSLFYKKIGGIPTVLSTGNGYAILQPIDMISLSNTIHSNRPVNDTAKKFLQFAERYLSNFKCDTGNHPSLKSCLIRIPESINTKNGNKVSIVQEWNKKRATVISLPFKKHLDVIEKRNKRTIHSKKPIPYIEKLLLTSLEDGKKRALALVLCPYLINVKGLSIDESKQILFEYFEKQFTLREIEYHLKRIQKKGILPYGIKKMKLNDPELYQIIMQKSV